MSPRQGHTTNGLHERARTVPLRLIGGLFLSDSDYTLLGSLD